MLAAKKHLVKQQVMSDNASQDNDFINEPIEAEGISEMTENPSLYLSR